VDVLASLPAHAQATAWCSQEIERSTTQRSLPSPDPCGLLGAAIVGVM
jgi:hypothetical protein